jgi:hypothetical protein
LENQNLSSESDGSITETKEDKNENLLTKKVDKMEKRFREKMVLMQKDPKLLIQGNRVPVGTEIAKNLARSFADSNESDRNDESIRARSFEVFDNKRLIFDIKEKENTVMELLEAIQFCHEKHSHFGMDKSLIDMTQNEAWSTISSKEDISDNKSDVTTLEFLDSLCVDV